MARAAIFEAVTADGADKRPKNRIAVAASAWPSPHRHRFHDVATYRAGAERLRQEAIRNTLLGVWRLMRRALER